jgi:hypothetical protein
LAFPFRHTESIWSESWDSVPGWIGRIDGHMRLHGVPVAHGGDFDRHDLEARAAALAGVRVRVTVEEHGAGKQLVRIRAWPRVSLGALAVVLSLAALSFVAWRDGAMVATGALGAMSVLLLAHLVRAAAAATAAVHNAVRRLREVATAIATAEL